MKLLCIHCFWYTAPPPCKGTCLPSGNPLFFERLYLSELQELIETAKDRDAVPTHISVYRDDSDLLFSIVFSRVNSGSACVVLVSVTPNKVLQEKRRRRKSHRLVTAACYFDKEMNHRCVAVICPKSQRCSGTVTRTLPSLSHCAFGQPYSDFQVRREVLQKKKFRVYLCKLYYNKNGTLLVDVCYVKGISVSVNDGITLRNLIQTIERNEGRGLYLTDGNARLVGSKLVFAAVFTTKTYGKCDYIVLYNLDASQLFERDRKLAIKGYHIKAIIPTTGNLTPLFIAVFWR